jgi:hypothetical protein
MSAPLPLSASVTTLVNVTANLVAVYSKKLLVVSATIFYQQPPTAHNKVIAALNQLCHHCPGAVLSNLICSHHRQIALKLSMPIATRSDPGLSDLILIRIPQALIFKTHHLNFTNCPLQLPESLLRCSSPDLTLVYQLKY